MRISVIGLAAVLCAGCSTTLTQRGAAVRIVEDADSRADCQYLGVVTGKNALFAPSQVAESESAMNDVRNKVVQAGGNSMRVVSDNLGGVIGSVITAEAYNCASR